MQINERIHGFIVNNIRHFDEIEADLYEMTHEKTSARLIWLKRPDDNKTFSIGFKTTPVDDTGVFHILEHSVLNGSRRYPVREPFVDLLKSSLQTFLNAMTFPDKTVYPVSSRNDKDFINLMRVYLDAVFYPLAKVNPNVFRQEGWHYEILKKEDEPIYKGVVFNEMKGAFSSPDGVRHRLLMHSLFPDTCYGNESGGDPVSIPKLTYKQFCESHDRYYSPSNSYIFLDGDMDIDQVLGIINDEYLSDFTSDGAKIDIEFQQPHIAEDVLQEYEIGAEEKPEGKAQIAYGYVTGRFDDYLRNTAFSILANVLCDSNESPLKRVILSNGLGEDIYFSLNDGIYQPYVEIDVINTDIEKEPEISKVLTDELKRLVREGIDRDELTATLNKAEFMARERDFGGAPKGLVFNLIAYDSWLYGGDPADSIIIGSLYDDLRKKMDEGYFESLLEEFILNSKHSAKVLLKPSTTLGREKAERERTELARAKQSWSEKELDELIKMNEELAVWQRTEDTPEQQATLPLLHLSDLKKTPTEYPVEICCHGGINKVFKHDINTNGISYVNMYSDIKDMSLNDISHISLLCGLLGQLATENYDTIHLIQKTKSLLGELNFSPAYLNSAVNNEARYYINVAWSTLSRNDLEGCELVKEVLYRTRFDNHQAIREIVRQTKTMLEQSFIGAGHAFGMTRVAAYVSSKDAAADFSTGYEFYKFIKNLEENWDSESDKTIARMEELYRKLFIRERLTVGIAAECKPRIVMSMLDNAPHGEAPLYVEKKPLGILNEGIVIPSNVSYACKGAPLFEQAKDRIGVMNVLSGILTYDYLWNNVRVKGGAYGCGFSGRAINFARFYSYRDPSPARTLGIFEKTPEYLRDFCNSDQNIEKYIIGSMGDVDPLLNPKAMAKRSDIECLSDITLEQKQAVLDNLLSTTKEDILNAIPLFDHINKTDAVCVVGNKDAIELCKDKLKNIFTL